MGKSLNNLKTALAGVLLAVGSTLSHAVPTTGGDQDFTWSFNTGAGVTITGFGEILTSLSGGNLVLAVSLTNTTALPAGTNMALMSFGFGIDPNATSVTFSDTADGMINAATMNTGGNTNIPSLTNIEVCAYGGNGCSGGPVGDGIQAGGGTDAFTLTLAGTWGSNVTIAPIGFKFQGTVGSFEFYSSSSSSSSSSSGTPPGSGAPEPGSTALALLGLSLLGASFWTRRKG